MVVSCVVEINVSTLYVSASEQAAKLYANEGNYYKHDYVFSGNMLTVSLFFHCAITSLYKVNYQEKGEFM